MNFYEDTLLAVRMLRDGRKQTTPALGSTCALCEWKRSCKEQCVNGRCLSLIPELGRSKKEALTGFFSTIDDLAAAELEHLLDAKGKSDNPRHRPCHLGQVYPAGKVARHRERPAAYPRAAQLSEQAD